MKTDQNFEVIIKKHWSIFIIPVFLILIGLFISPLSTFLKYLGSVIVVFNLYKIYYNSTVKLTLTTTEILISKGIFPWSKTYIEIPIFNVYESIVTYGMLGHFLDYGTITIRRTDGNSTEITETKLKNVKNFSGQLNYFIYENIENKQNVFTNSISANKHNFAFELKQLADLKNNGELSQIEFEKMKEIIISNN